MPTSPSWGEQEGSPALGEAPEDRCCPSCRSRRHGAPHAVGFRKKAWAGSAARCQLPGLADWQRADCIQLTADPAWPRLRCSRPSV